MKRSVILASVLAVAMPMTSVHAVDVVNEDDAAYTILVEDAGGEREVTVGPGAEVPGICESCSVFLEDEGIDVEGEQIVVIRDKKLMLAP